MLAMPLTPSASGTSLPRVQISLADPFDQWPTGRGFDRYYGFLWGEEDQWAPELWYDQHRVDPPRRHGYHLSQDIVDHAQAFLADHQTAAPERPFLLYVAFGACHAPPVAPRLAFPGQPQHP
jgi:arylsulfatase A-like enzyme